MMGCGCGCGQDAGVYTRTNGCYGYVKGAERRFVPGHSRRRSDLFPGLVGEERARAVGNAKKRRSYHRHGDRNRARGREYAQINSAAAVERVRRWREEHPHLAREKRRMYEAGRRARKRGQFVEHVDPQIVWERDEGVCGICNTAADHDTFHVDHRIPLSKGGEHSYANTQVSHPGCNLRKGARVGV